MTTITLTVNGQPSTHTIEPRTLLVHLLREHLQLNGTHIGCDTSQCGACVVHINGQSAKSCTVLAVQCEGAEITTVEGLAKGRELHPLQSAFWEKHGLQCGFCTSGMLMSALELLDRNPDPSESDIRHALKGNLCRCTGYEKVIEAIQVAAQQRLGQGAAQ